MMADSQPQSNDAVLVVGGSLVGLSSAIFLASLEVPVVLIETHLQSSPHPRAIGYTPRTLELFRSVGLDSQIPQVSPGRKLRRIRVESLTGKWFEESSWTPPKAEDKSKELEVSPKEYSLCRGAAIAQDTIEPILRQKAIELQADMRLGHKLLRFEQDDDGVTAYICRIDETEYTMRASYLVAADGHRSSIREALGIGRSGRGHIETLRSVLFRAPLQEYLEKGFSQFSIDSEGLKAFLTTYNDGRWVLIFSDDIERDEDTARSLIYKAVGRNDLDVEIITTGRWEMGAHVADTFASQRVFLVGDAAHTFPPSRGGYGANTGIEDAHNLAWKLSAVLKAVSTPELLETYDAERRPIAWLRHQQIFARDDYKAKCIGTAYEKAPEIYDDDAMEFGQLYRSSAVKDADESLPPAARPEKWAGQPGTRAPHINLELGSDRISTLDLFQGQWILLSADDSWSCTVQEAKEQVGIELEFWCIGNNLASASIDTFLVEFGISRNGATLVRPDGYVAWRSLVMPTDPLYTLVAAFRQVSSART